ncbi:MAG: sigma-70 family RNA polymerase sigma factor [Ruminococcus sp.]|nr:sigma-70 family RNA polymerase sigma factor [Ruminococcus sp.]
MHKDDPRKQDLEKTMNEYKNTVYGITLTMLINKSEADDVFQEVFLLYFLKQPFFESPAAKKAWLIKVTINKCRQQNSSKWNMNVDKTDEFDHGISLETQEDKDLYAAVRALPQKTREAVYLHYFIGLSVNETAEMLGVRANAVSMRLAKAKKLLQKRLEEDL